MFYAAEALLLDRGLVFSKHSSVISEFGKLFVKAGLFRAERHADLRMAFDERNIGDYGHGPFPKSAAEEILGKANDFMTDAETRRFSTRFSRQSFRTFARESSMQSRPGRATDRFRGALESIVFLELEAADRRISHRLRDREGDGPTYTLAMNALPGGDLIGAGLADLSQGLASIGALLVSIGAPRLRRIGIEVPAGIPNPEDKLYELLENLDPNSAHSRYNTLIRRLLSFERAAEWAANSRN